MLIQVGCELAFTFQNPTALLLMLNLHPSVTWRVNGVEQLEVDPQVEISSHIDVFGNRCSRVYVPAGFVAFRHSALVEDDGMPDRQSWCARQDEVKDLPNDVLPFLLASRYCEVDSSLADFAWNLFSSVPGGWQRVQAICDFTHDYIRFDYQQARPTRTALEVFQERTGVCRDFMHLAITLCRCLNIPARYCTGYLGDIGVPATYPMDYSAWFEVFLDGSWHTFDARNNVPRIGRILMARGRDAADVAITTSFGVNQLQYLRVVTDEVPVGAGPAPTKAWPR